MSDPLVLSDVDASAHAAANQTLAREMWCVLKQHYPDHPWLVFADHDTGMAGVKLQYSDVLGENLRYGYRIKIKRLASDPAMRVVVRAGGELLERFRLARAKRTIDSGMQARENGLDLSHADDRRKPRRTEVWRAGT